MKAKRFLALAILCLFTINAASQTSAETRQYNKIVKKASVALIDNFLKKYPNSTYTEDLVARRDTLLSITPYSNEEAKEIMSQFITEAEYHSFPVREEGIDKIYSVQLMDDSYIFYNAVLEVKGKKSAWKLLETDSFQTNMEEAAQLEDNNIQAQIQIIGGDKYLICSYLYGRERYVYFSYCPSNHQFAELVFSGKTIENRDGSIMIEGTSNNSLYGQARSDVAVLSMMMDNNPMLKRIPNDILLSDLAIEDWLNANPDALTNAKKVTMLSLPKEASLIELFEKAKKSSNSKYSAAIIDVRGWTVVVVKQKSDGNYLLAWAEVECKDHKNDRLLNSLSFTDANSMKMSYYHGRKTFNYILNIASKTLSR